MAESIVLVIANKKKVRLSGGTVLLPDCTMSIEHRFDNDVTEHPIDGKANVSDHVVNKNHTIHISGVYSAYSLEQYPSDTIGTKNRIARAYEELLRLRNDKLKFSVVSRYGVYNDCVVKSLTIPIAPDQGNSLIFNMEIVQVRVSDNIQTVQLIQIENVSDSVVDSAAVKQKVGVAQKNKTSSTPAVEQLDRLVNGGNG